MLPYTQLSVADIFADCQNKFEDDKPAFLALLWALIIQRIFSIPTDQLLLTFLRYSKPLREFCGFTRVPDASKITRFKQDFLKQHPLIQPKTFPGDSAFGATNLYKELLTGNTFGTDKSQQLSCYS